MALDFVLGVIVFVFLGIISYSVYKWSKCKNSAEIINFYSGAASIVIFYEFIVLFVGMVYILLNDSEKRILFSNLISSKHLIDFIAQNPSAGITFIIGLISIISVYLYFFLVLGKTKYFSEKSEIQDKYVGIFWSVAFIIFGCGFLLPSIVQGSLTENYFNILLFVISILNIVISVPLAYYLKIYFFNLNLSDEKSEILKQGEYSYKFLEEFQQLRSSFIEDLSSDAILMTTFILVGLSILINCNLFLLLMAEFCLLILFYWIKQLELLPNKKTTIEIVDTDSFGNFHSIKDIFILSDSEKDYVVILDKNNQIRMVMKNRIHQLIDQIDAPMNE